MRLEKVRKRNGTITDFEEDNIVLSIKKALDATKTKAESEKIYDILEARYLNGYKKKIISVEELQNFIESTLMKEGLCEAARAYITYRYQRRQFRDTKNAIENIVNDYVDRSSWRVNENSNITYSYPAMQGHISGNLLAHYTLRNIYPSNIADAHTNGDFHIHDLSMGTAPYCCGHSLRTLLLEGFGGVPGKLYSRPPSHLSSAVDQLINFLGVLQNEWAGAQAVNSFDTFLAPYVKKENLSFVEVKQCMENFIYGVNVTSRWGQSPFTNISLDWTVPDDLATQPVIISGKDQGYTYKDCHPEMQIVQKAFLSVMCDGDANQTPFTFPVLTIGITKDFDYESENAKLLFALTAKYGTPYFQNFVNSGLNPSDIRSMCCRLSLNLAELRKHTGGIFGAGDSTGSIGVVTINLPRLGYLTDTKRAFLNKLGKLMDLAKDSLLLKRKVLNTNMERGLYPYTKRYLSNFNRHFSTIGLVGTHECCLNLLGQGIESEEGKKFAEEVLVFMRARIERYTKDTGTLFNLEATPAEGASYRLAKIDKEKFGDIISCGNEVPFYTNSTHLPVNFTDDLFEVLDHQDSLQTKYTSGTVLHIFTGEALEGEGTAVLVKRVVDNYKLPYFSVTPTFSICPTHKYMTGTFPECPHCNAECAVYSRVVGYYRPVGDWNRGKQAEFKERKEYVV